MLPDSIKAYLPNRHDLQAISNVLNIRGRGGSSTRPSRKLELKESGCCHPRITSASIRHYRKPSSPVYPSNSLHRQNSTETLVKEIRSHPWWHLFQTPTTPTTANRYRNFFKMMRDPTNLCPRGKASVATKCIFCLINFFFARQPVIHSTQTQTITQPTQNGTSAPGHVPVAAEHTTTKTLSAASSTKIPASTASNLRETETHKERERQMTHGSQLPDKWQSQLSNDTQMSKWQTQLCNDTQIPGGGESHQSGESPPPF